MSETSENVRNVKNLQKKIAAATGLRAIAAATFAAAAAAVAAAADVFAILFFAAPPSATSVAASIAPPFGIVAIGAAPWRGRAVARASAGVGNDARPIATVDCGRPSDSSWCDRWRI